MTFAANIPALTVATPKSPKSLPHDIDLEQQLLGLLLVDNGAYDQVADFLTPHHFFDPFHARMYGLISQLIGQGNLASPATVKVYLEQDEGFAHVGGSEYLAHLASSAIPLPNIAQYATMIQDLALRRELVRISQEMGSKALDSDISFRASNQIEDAEKALYSLAETGQGRAGFLPLDAALKEAIDTASHAYSRKGGLSGLAMGLKDLDAQMGGLQKSDLIILAGRPSMGKTAFATTVAYNVAAAYEKSIQDGNTTAENSAENSATPQALEGAPVAFFSLEMSAEQLATRLLAEKSGIPSEKIRRGKIKEEEYHKIVEAARVLESLPIYIDQTGALTINAIAARARRLKRQQNIGLIVVDYLQLVHAANKRGDNRVQEVSEVTQGLKALAKELDVPVLALSQLSRQVEQRDDKRPQLSDLRESGSIEQDADVVVFIYREEYYIGHKEPTPGTSEHMEWQDKMHAVHGVAESIIGKHRHGPTGTVRLQFQANITRFSDLTEQDYPQA